MATGFLRLTPDPTSQGESGLIQDRISVITDEMQVFGSGILGLTIQLRRMPRPQTGADTAARLLQVAHHLQRGVRRVRLAHPH